MGNHQDIISNAIESRKLYLQSFYIYTIGAIIAITGIITHSYFLGTLSVSTLAIGLLMNFVALVKHLSTLNSIKNTGKADPYTPARNGILAQIILLLITLLSLLTSHNAYHPKDIYINLWGIGILLNIGIWWVFFRKMFQEIGKFLGRPTTHLFTLGFTATITNSIGGFLRPHQLGVISYTLYGIG